MNPTVITVSVVAILVLFAAWALAPAVRTNRQRILRSPATWSVVVLLLSILWMQWAQAQIRRQMEAFDMSMEMQHKLLAIQTNRADAAFLDKMDKQIKARARELSENQNNSAATK